MIVVDTGVLYPAAFEADFLRSVNAGELTRGDLVEASGRAFELVP